MGKREFVTVVLAAGKGKRMKDPNLPKVMYKVNGKPMVHYVVDLAKRIGSESVIVVVGNKREIVMKYLEAAFGDGVVFALQQEQLGTGHAVLQTEDMLSTFDGEVLVLSGDVPILTEKTIRRLIDAHYQNHSIATVLTAMVDDPTGYGRILRLSDGSVDRIVEEKDSSAQQKKIKEINSGIYLFSRKELFEALHHINSDNAQHEYYLTDVLGYFAERKIKISAVAADDFNEIRGVNTPEQLDELEKIVRNECRVSGG
ncbi:MAG TPA: sugar phosphate nucleotidyltransferase [Candidatus Acidoferrales bacterium]|nr:sugar phosphate nucleotidyltransferase [Candidatus Acidoferrales bacterium]